MYLLRWTLKCVATALQPATCNVESTRPTTTVGTCPCHIGGLRPMDPKSPLKRRRAPVTDTSSSADVIDVRSLVPAERHAKIFELVNALEPGASFILVNDHDPKPLYYQMEAEYPGQFSWAYVEQGPQVWRVEIGKHAKAA
jgi:uncharacterized protein (DUF2249 family)